METDIKNTIRDLVKTTISRLLEENNIVSLDRFKKEKRDKEGYYGEVLVSKDGMVTLDPNDYYFIKLTHRDQADAIIDGNIELAETLGAIKIPLIGKTIK